MRIPHAIGFLILGASQPALAQGPTGSVVAVDVYGPSERAKADLRGTAASRVFDALAAARLTVTPVSDANLAAEILDCVGDPCLQDLAKSADLALVVQVRIQAKKTAKKGKLDYTISMVVARDVPDRNSWREKGICPECDATEAKQQVFLIAGTIGDRIQGESQKAKQAPIVSGPASPPVAAAPPLTAAAPPVLVNPPQVEKEPAGWYVPRYLSIAALGGGAALIATGVVLHSISGKGTCGRSASDGECAQTYDTGKLGTGLIVGGSVVAVGGLASLFFLAPNNTSSNLALGLGASSISVRGRF
jgi:hypothetical protein